MLRRQAFQFELVTNRRQVSLMRQFAGARRFVFTKALALEKERYQRREIKTRLCGSVQAADRVCGYRARADLVAALNILAAGHAVIACGESVLEGRSVKQEATEVAQAAVGISAL